MRGKPVSALSVILSRVMHPNDASYLGTGHGGVILRMLDEAGGMAAVRHARKPVVTAAIDSMSFLAPLYVGNLVTADDRRRMAAAELRRKERAARRMAGRKGQ